MTVDGPVERRPGRPTREATAALHELVVQGARAVFVERGRSTTMDDVAAAIGVSKLTIYRRFPTKDALIVAVVEHDLDELDRRIVETVSPDRTPIENLRNVAARIFDFVTDSVNVRMSRLLLHDFWQNEDLRDAIARWERITRGTMLLQIEHAQAEGTLSGDIPAAELCAILSEMIEGQGERLRYDSHFPTPDEFRAIFNSRWAFFLRGAAGSSG